MAKKKVAKKKVVRKNVAKKSTKKKAVKKKVVKKKAVKKKVVGVKKKPLNSSLSKSNSRKRGFSIRNSMDKIPYKEKSKVALFNLVLFALLSVLSYILYLVSGTGLYEDTFYLLFIVLAFVSLAFLLLFLIFFFAKGKMK